MDLPNPWARHTPKLPLTPNTPQGCREHGRGANPPSGGFPHTEYAHHADVLLPG